MAATREAGKVYPMPAKRLLQGGETCIGQVDLTRTTAVLMISR